MILAIQQPEHLPWLGFFDKMSRCDLYVFLDNVQFKKRYFENRNKIRTREGWQWIVVPVISKGHYTQKINEVVIDNSRDWQRKYLGALQASYAKAPHFPEFYPAIQAVITKPHEHLVLLNLELIDSLRCIFDIDTPTALASDLLDSGCSGSELILQLCLKCKADVYLSGPDGINYLQLERFQAHGIEVQYHTYRHPVYSQLHGSEFFSHMSAVDRIFNHGKDVGAA